MNIDIVFIIFTAIIITVIFLRHADSDGLRHFIMPYYVHIYICFYVIYISTYILQVLYIYIYIYI